MYDILMNFRITMLKYKEVCLIYEIKNENPYIIQLYN